VALGSNKPKELIPENQLKTLQVKVLAGLAGEMAQFFLLDLLVPPGHVAQLSRILIIANIKLNESLGFSLAFSKMLKLCLTLHAPQPDDRWNRIGDHSPDSIFLRHTLDISLPEGTCEAPGYP
jgi:hypothetical protein